MSHSWKQQRFYTFGCKSSRVQVDLQCDEQQHDMLHDISPERSALVGHTPDVTISWIHWILLLGIIKPTKSPNEVRILRWQVSLTSVCVWNVVNTHTLVTCAGKVPASLALAIWHCQTHTHTHRTNSKLLFTHKKPKHFIESVHLNYV